MNDDPTPLPEETSAPEPYVNVDAPPRFGIEPAFPIPPTSFRDGANGLSKREMLAAMVLQGLTAGRNHNWGSDYCAEEAVRLADSLLKELSK